MLKPHPNEAGNDIEPFVKKALGIFNIKAEVPTGSRGNKNLQSPYPLMSNMSLILTIKGSIQENQEQRYYLKGLFYKRS